MVTKFKVGKDVSSKGFVAPATVVKKEEDLYDDDNYQEDFVVESKHFCSQCKNCSCDPFAVIKYCLDFEILNYWKALLIMKIYRVDIS